MLDELPVDEQRFQVLSTCLVTPVIRELRLAPCEAALHCRPGQYVLLSDTDYQVPPRSYSVANAPRADGQVSLLVTRVPGGPNSSWVHDQLHPGDEVTLAGPYGTFVIDPDHHGPVLLLVAGSGLAPARALAEAIVPHRPERPVTLFFSARTPADTIDRERFEGWARTCRSFHYVLTLTRDAGAPLHQRIPALLSRTVGDLHGWEVFAAGPPGFVTDCAAAARVLGADAAMVHTEAFFADPQPWAGRPPASAGAETARPR